MEETKKIRLQKWLAAQGVGSRRAVEKMIAQGRIAVDGEVIKEQGVKIEAKLQQVTVDGVEVRARERWVYYLVYKPRGVISAAKSQSGEPVVVDLVKSDRRLFPVGRLDKDSEGLIILTNDGELTHRLTHPKYHIDKTYEVKVKGKINERKLSLLRTGINLTEGVTAPAVVEQTGRQRLTITIHEGKYRQVRRMCQRVDLTVERLLRTKIGQLDLAGLAAGNFRVLAGAEVTALRAAAGLAE